MGSLGASFALACRRSRPAAALLAAVRLSSGPVTSGGSSRAFSGVHGDGEDQDRLTTPWVRTVISGVDLMRNPKYNKGFAFTERERDRLYLRGLLPPAVLDQDVQIERAIINFRSKSSDLEKYQYLQGLHERNERLFFCLLQEYIEECLPIIHRPTVGAACERYGLMFRSLPRSLFVCLADKGAVVPLLKNWPERAVKAIAVSDGEEVACYGDLGLHSVGIPISILGAYSAYGGIRPERTMPVCMDPGTDNQSLLDNQFYVGTRQPRERGERYTELLDEFMEALQHRYGSNIFVNLEGMSWNTVQYLLTQYRGSFPVFSEQYQGKPCAILAGLISAFKQTDMPAGEHTFLIAGNGPAAAATAEMLAAYIAHASDNTVYDVRDRIWLLDSKGLITRGQEHNSDGGLEDYQFTFAHEGPTCKTLSDAVKAIKPTILIGCSTGATKPPFPFNEQVLSAMSSFSEQPVIFSVSDSPEVTAWEAYKWTKGKCIFAGGHNNTHSVTLDDGSVRWPSKIQSLPISVGLCSATLAARAIRLRDEQLIVAAETVSSLVSAEDAAKGMVFPDICRLVQTSKEVATAVARKAYELGIATALPKPASVSAHINQNWYNPKYREYR